MNLIRIAISDNFEVHYDIDRGMYRVSIFEDCHFQDEIWFDAYEEKEIQNTGIMGAYHGTLICCKTCGHTVESIHTEDRLNCPMWCAVGIDPNGFCHMWRPKE